MDYYSPATASPPSRSKRSLSVSSSDFGDAVQPVKKAKGKRSSAAREQRMERNRQAAQASRDRKKVQQEQMESRIAELEAQLAAAHPITTLPSSRHAVSRKTGGVSNLEEENESLRTQLQLERLESGALKARLSALEMKFSRLADLLGGASTSTSSVSIPSVPLPTPPTTFLDHTTLPTPPSLIDASPLQVASTETDPVTSLVDHVEIGQDATSAATTLTQQTQQEMQDSLRLVAREVSLPRKLSQITTRRLMSPSSTPSSSPPVSTTRPTPRRQPTLHQILSAISLPSSQPPSPISRSPTPGTIGLPRSISAAPVPVKVLVRSVSVLTASRSGVQASAPRSRSRSMRREDCSRSFSTRRRRFQLFVRR